MIFLTDAGVLPIYLHQADWTAGTFGFRVPVARGQALMAQLPGLVGGPSIPRYVVDLPGGGGKTSLTDRGVRCLEQHTDRQSGLGGALYALARPQVRPMADTSLETAALYVDLYRLE